MGTPQKVGIAGGLILAGMALGLWIGRPHKANVDLGAAPTQYVPSGILTLIDSGGVELATLQIDLMPALAVPVRIDFDNGPEEPLGWYVYGVSYQMLTLYSPIEHKTDAPGSVLVDISPEGALHVESSPPDHAKQIEIPIKAAYKPTRFSKQWWMEFLFSSEQKVTLQTELASEDSRLIKRDGMPFAVCGHDRFGNAAMVIVSSDYTPQAAMTFATLQGSLASLQFGVFGRKGQSIALLETDSPRGPRLSVASEDRLSNTGDGLFTLDRTGTKLGGDIVNPGLEDGIVNWLARPMYRARLPIRLVDATGKVIWLTGKS